jgi:hypothetical protein
MECYVIYIPLIMDITSGMLWVEHTTCFETQKREKKVTNQKMQKNTVEL